MFRGRLTKNIMKKIEVKFNKELYSAVAVKKAADDFGKAAKILFKKQPNYYHVTIEAYQPEEGELVRNNFINYVLFFSRARL